MTLDMTQEIIDIIRSGDVDEDLEQIRMEVLTRQTILIGQKRAEEYQQKKYGEQIPDIPHTDFKFGCIVEVNGRLRPNYLFGSRFVVKKVNDKTVVVDVPNDPKFRRYAGSNNVRIPKTALRVVG